jgi:predicted transcriptional regulator
MVLNTGDKYLLYSEDYRIALPRMFLESYPQYKDKDIAFHLAIFIEPYFTRIMDGVKKFESRFSINKIAPYDRIKKGDIVFVKKSSDNIFGFFVAGNVEFKTISDLQEIKKEYAENLCIDSDDFWEQKKNAKYLTIIEITGLKETQHVAIEKKDPSAWVILQKRKTMKIETL